VSLATEAALEVIDTDPTIVAFVSQPAKRDQAAHEVMPLRLLGTHLTASAAPLIFANPDDFFNLLAQVI
jgi:hypothetical protein